MGWNCAGARSYRTLTGLKDESRLSYLLRLDGCDEDLPNAPVLLQILLHGPRHTEVCVCLGAEVSLQSPNQSY